MELGVLGLDGFQCSDNASIRSVGLKQEGSGFCADDWRFPKVAKTDGDYSPSSASTALFLQTNTTPPFKSVSSEPNMLTFSSSKPDTCTFPYFQQTPPVLPKNTGYYSGGLNVLNGVRGPFTQSQWFELEQQALIYKYLTANEPIPAHLLIPIKKALESAVLFAFNGGTLRPSPWGWSPYHFGYSNSTDPEPGRCRRTDGKKWRCSRDAMPDQKYCERHMNRGRHRSRKLVEGQANAPTKSTTTTKPTPLPSMVAPKPGISDNFDMTQHYHQAKSLLHHSAVDPLPNRMVMNHEESGQGIKDTSQLSFLSLSGSNANLNCSEDTFSILKHRNCNSASSPSIFEVPSTGGSPLFTITTSQKNSPFCSGNGNGESSILWPGLQTQSNDKGALLPLRVSEQLEMGLGVGAQSYNNNRQSSWIPSSWEPSMGGPLGEALQSSSSNSIHEECKKTWALDLLPKGWEGMGSYQLSSSSPTGVLQKSACVSLSNSSAGSSPRTDNSKAIECTAMAHSSSMPALN